MFVISRASNIVELLTLVFYVYSLLLLINSVRGGICIIRILSFNPCAILIHDWLTVLSISDEKYSINPRKISVTNFCVPM